MVYLQEKLLDLPEAEAAEGAEREVPSGQEAKASRPKLKAINRAQMVIRPVDVERLIPADHRARATWEVAGRMDLSGFCEGIESQVGEAGRACWDPRLLVSIWVYAYSEGIRSAREMEREMEYEPGLMWLSGLEVVNHHTLSDFRGKQQAGLEKIFRELLAVLESEGLVDLQQVMVDGTKVRASASRSSFRRKPKLEEHLSRAREVVEQMKQAETEGQSVREAAQQRASRERQERLEAALKEIEELEAGKKETEAAKVRVSESEPEARRMKQADGGYAPSYNVQLSVDAKAKIVVGAHVTQDGNDLQQLEPALEQVVETMGRKPEQVVADGGYASRANIVKMAEEEVEFISTLASEEKKAEAALKGQGVAKEFMPEAFRWDAENNCLLCPADKPLRFERHETRESDHRFAIYRASLEDCQGCLYRQQCCPKTGQRTMKRVVGDHPAVEAFRQNMSQEEKQKAYKKRAAVSEIVNGWLKEKMGLRRFRLRGKKKARIEVLWACLSYNISQWIRIRKSGEVLPIPA